ESRCWWPSPGSAPASPRSVRVVVPRGSSPPSGGIVRGERQGTGVKTSRPRAPPVGSGDRLKPWALLVRLPRVQGEEGLAEFCREAWPRLVGSRELAEDLARETLART